MLNPLLSNAAWPGGTVASAPSVVRYLDVGTRWLAELDAGDTRGRILAAVDRRLFLEALAAKSVADEVSWLCLRHLGYRSRKLFFVLGQLS